MAASVSIPYLMSVKPHTTYIPANDLGSASLSMTHRLYHFGDVAEHSDDAQVVQAVREILPGGGNEITGREQRDTTLVINTENISRAEEILTPLAQRYQMPQVLQNAQYLLPAEDEELGII